MINPEDDKQGTLHDGFVQGIVDKGREEGKPTVEIARQAIDAGNPFETPINKFEEGEFDQFDAEFIEVNQAERVPDESEEQFKRRVSAGVIKTNEAYLLAVGSKDSSPDGIRRARNLYHEKFNRHLTLEEAENILKSKNDS